MLNDTVIEKARSAKAASAVLYTCTTVRKNSLLRALCRRLREAAPAILEANEADLRDARESGLSAVLLDRLTLSSSFVVPA